MTQITEAEVVARRSVSFATRSYPLPTDSFRSQLVFGIWFALTRSRELLRRILREHAPTELAGSWPSRSWSTWTGRVSDR